MFQGCWRSWTETIEEDENANQGASEEDKRMDEDMEDRKRTMMRARDPVCEKEEMLKNSTVNGTCRVLLYVRVLQPFNVLLLKLYFCSFLV